MEPICTVKILKINTQTSTQDPQHQGWAHSVAPSVPQSLVWTSWANSVAPPSMPSPVTERRRYYRNNNRKG